MVRLKTANGGTENNLRMHMCALSPCSCHSSLPRLHFSHTHTHSLFKACPLCISSVKEMRMYIISEKAQNAGRRQTNVLCGEAFQVLFNSQVSSEETVYHYFTTYFITSLPPSTYAHKTARWQYTTMPLDQEMLGAFLLRAPHVQTSCVIHHRVHRHYHYTPRQVHPGIPE